MSTYDFSWLKPLQYKVSEPRKIYGHTVYDIKCIYNVFEKLSIMFARGNAGYVVSVGCWDETGLVAVVYFDHNLKVLRVETSSKTYCAPQFTKRYQDVIVPLIQNITRVREDDQI